MITAIPLKASGDTFIYNPSFEYNYNENWPHYSSIDGWTGGSGVNRADGPFHNTGTPVPDQEHVGFQQGTGSISQPVYGLTPGEQYWIQFYYDSRNGGLVTLRVVWTDDNGEEHVLDTIPEIAPVTGGAPYRLRTVKFTPETEGGILSFRTQVTTDSTLLLDGVQIVQRGEGQAVLQNPSFEASGDPIDPAAPLAAIAGWVIDGFAGVDGVGGPMVNNGAVPDQDHAAWIQGPGSLTQVVPNLVPGQSYKLTFACNARSGDVARLRVRVDGASLYDEEVTPVGGNAAWRTVSLNFVAAQEDVEIVFEQTASGSNTLLLDDVKIEGQQVEPPPNVKIGPRAMELAPGERIPVQVTVSEERLRLGESRVVLEVANGTVARFVDDAGDGTVTLVFPKDGGLTTLEAEIEGLERGNTRVNVLDNGGHLDVDGTVTINVVSSIVRNPSFEAGAPVPPFGYGQILSWTDPGAQSVGVNNSSLPFADNGRVPDRNQVAFIQGSQIIGQTLRGLTAGQTYWLQFFYNVRNCCGGTMNFSAALNGEVVYSAEDVQPVGAGVDYYFANIPFTAEDTTAELQFMTQAAGDASLLLDGVCVVARDASDIVVKNPSFEAGGVPTGVGYVQPGGIAGWTAAGSYGLNVDTFGPFTDNGEAGDQDRVLFLQNASSISQDIEGLTPSESYRLSFLMNARRGDAPGGTPFRVVLDEEVLEEGVQEPVGVGEPYELKEYTFTAQSDTVNLRIECVPEEGEDQSLLLDNVRIQAASAGPGPDPDPGPLNVSLTAALLNGNSIVIRWPASAPAGLKLQTSTSLSANSWTDVTAPVNVVDGQNEVVTPVTAGETRRFFRLARP